ncbi:MAG: hypothetical protein AVDCRST_MAG95-882 [uncultured Adhaeribacter sp.]|uniref:Uncharacterized protein n=1 Tax=uncultured Adhaeribacter sp. TaxID=448109 RepID=A0A6J4HNH7_9BACT|nr:MAG: hypothetical protein AVDCRST_MAG95-882 [uncultured Adhaeribacter sp.]
MKQLHKEITAIKSETRATNIPLNIVTQAVLNNTIHKKTQYPKPE